MRTPLIHIPSRHGNDLEALTLDQLWEVAYKIAARNEGGLFKSGKITIFAYPSMKTEVGITFFRPTGTEVDAKGKGDDIRQCFVLAIQEAITLGAK